MKNQIPIKFRKGSIFDHRDIESIVELSQYLPEPVSEGQLIERLLFRKHWIRFTSDFNQKDIAFSIWYEDAPEDIYFFITATHPNYTRRRIGEKLLRASIAISQKEGYSNFSLRTFNQCYGMLKLCNRLELSKGNWERLDDPYGKNSYCIEYNCNLKSYQFPFTDKKHTLILPSELVNGNEK